MILHGKPCRDLWLPCLPREQVQSASRLTTPAKPIEQVYHMPLASLRTSFEANSLSELPSRARGLRGLLEAWFFYPAWPALLGSSGIPLFGAVQSPAVFVVSAARKGKSGAMGAHGPTRAWVGRGKLAQIAAGIVGFGGLVLWCTV